MKTRLCFAALAAATSLARADLPEPPAKPNFIVVLMDDWGYNDVGCYTYPSKTNYYPDSGPEPNFPETDPQIPPPNLARTLTPRLDLMADQGIRFTSYYSCARNCTPARAALITGCYPPRVDMPNVINPGTPYGLNTTEITIAEVLKAQGYATGMVGKWHLGYNPAQTRAAQFLPTRHGFDSYLGIPYSNDMFQVENFLIEDETPVLTMGTGWADAGVNQHTVNWRYTERALEFIEDNQSEPFFLYLAHSMPHVPTWPSQSTFTNADGTTWPQFAGASGFGWYYDIVMEIDHSMGRILDKLDDPDGDGDTSDSIANETFVLFTSDNGPWLKKSGIDLDDVAVGCAYPLRESKSTSWEGGPRVPCIARWPGMIPAGQVSDEVAGHIDLLPTLVKLAGTAPPTDRIIDGKDIWPILSGQPGAASPHSEYDYYYGDTIHGVRRGPWKFRRPDASTRQLYHLDNDIQERTNEYTTDPGPMADLAVDLESTMNAFEAALKANERKHVNFSDQEIVVDNSRLTLTEGGTASFQVKLIQDPGGTVEVRARPVFGDDSISVSSGATLSFDAATWDTWQTVTIAAAEDPDTLGSGAIVRCSSTSFAPVREVFAVAADNDTTPQIEASLVWPKIADTSTAGTDVLMHAEGLGIVNAFEDPVGTTYAWTATAGPPGVAFTGPTAAATGISFPANGDYTIQFQAAHPEAGSDSVSFDVTVGATPVSIPANTLAYSADADTDGDTTWEETGGTTTRNWSLAANVHRSDTDPAPNLPGIDAAYEFTGNSIPAGATSLHFDAFSTANASIELWFKPDDLATGANQIIWETGGDIGASFTRNGSTLSFTADDGSGNTPTGATATTTMAAGGGHDGFIHAVGVIDLSGDALQIYLNGSDPPGTTDTASIPAVNDWCGTSYTGLGTVADSSGNETTNDGHLGGNDLLGAGPWNTFAGQIARVRFYDRVLTPAEVASLFAAASVGGVGPEVDAGSDQNIAFTAIANLAGTASDDGQPGPPPATGWTQAAGPGTATIADPAALATTATFSLPGSYQMRLFADDTQVRVYDDATVTVAPLTYAEWAAGIAFPPGDGDPEDNPDGDPWTNLWEWALGLDPLAFDPATSGPAFTAEHDETNRRLTIEFDKPRDRSPTIGIRESTNLSNWDAVLSPVPSVVPISDTLERWTFTYDIPATEPRWFLQTELAE